MDPNERRHILRELLKDEIAENRARIAERQAAREADPIKMDEYLRSDPDFRTTEPIGSPYVQRDSADVGLVFKTNDNALLPAPQPQDEAFYEEPTFTEQQRDVIAEMIVELRREWRKDIKVRDVRGALTRHLAENDAEIAEVKGMLGAVLQLLEPKKRRNA